jgi:hypothetical protein
VYSRTTALSVDTLLASRDFPSVSRRSSPSNMISNTLGRSAAFLTCHAMRWSRSIRAVHRTCLISMQLHVTEDSMAPQGNWLLHTPPMYCCTTKSVDCSGHGREPYTRSLVAAATPHGLPTPRSAESNQYNEYLAWMAI